MLEGNQLDVLLTPTQELARGNRKNPYSSIW